MKDKIILLVFIIIFIGIMLLLNNILQKENNKIVLKEKKILNNQEEKKEMVIKVNSENFENEVLKSEKTVLIDFYADWCGPCQMLSPIVEEIASENNNIKFVKINIDDEQDLAINYDIMSIPTLVVIKNGKEENRVVGVVSKSKIEDMLK